MEFHKVTIKQLDRSVPESVVITFDIPKEIQDQFSFIQGQFLTLQKTIDDQQVRRSYSLCSAPQDGEWKVAVKKIPTGVFSTFAQDILQVGDSIELAAPDGKFYIPVDATTPRTFVAFAAGSGITPILSIIKTHLNQEPNSTFKLFYTNKTTQSIMLKEELESLKNQFMDRFEIFYFLTEEHRQIPFFNGRVDKDKLDQIFKIVGPANSIDHFFLCGPEQMILMIKEYLNGHGLEDNQIHFELFFSGSSNEAEIESIAEAHKGQKTALRIIEGGKSFDIEVTTGKGNVLDHALNRGADLPYACKGGVCCTCRAKLISGEVEMPKTFGLEPEEIENGYILTCQAIPLTEEVVVNFDD